MKHKMTVSVNGRREGRGEKGEEMFITFENLWMMRPVGVDSKKERGARRTRETMLRCITWRRERGEGREKMRRGEKGEGKGGEGREVRQGITLLAATPNTHPMYVRR